MNYGLLIMRLATGFDFQNKSNLLADSRTHVFPGVCGELITSDQSAARTREHLAASRSAINFKTETDQPIQKRYLL